MEQIINNIYNKIACVKNAIVIEESNDSPKPWDSKVGGKAYLLEDDDYPVSMDTGEPFEFLIQINCSNLPENDYFPKKGLLQFFINNEYNYEEDDEPFLIKYIENITIDEKKLDFDLEDDYELDEDDENDEDDDSFNCMIDEEIKVNFKTMNDHVNSTSFEWNEFKQRLAKELYEYKDELEDYESIIENSSYLEDLDFILNDEDVIEVMQASKLLGYPDNFEEDIRLNDSKYHEYILFLQLNPNSDFFENEEEISICWFIHPNDLKNLDFSNVICSYFPK
ncbi:uncharacterized protein YwqG [Bacilli bacterium PM5-3]|nr:uncharacterized protein YwqG [Bacilli bacterium PM5-3]